MGKPTGLVCGICSRAAVKLAKPKILGGKPSGHTHKLLYAHSTAKYDDVSYCGPVLGVCTLKEYESACESISSALSEVRTKSGRGAE